MCVIIFKDQGAVIKEEYIENAFRNNPHGSGFTAIVKDEIINYKGIMTYENLLNIVSMFNKPDYKLILHSRIKSKGELSMEMTHPFPITDTIVKDYGNYMVFKGPSIVHNGASLLSLGNDKVSDTYEFSILLKNMINSGIDIDEFLKSSKDILEKLIKPNRVIVTTYKDIYIFGKEYFIDVDDGIIASNESCLPYGYFYGWRNYYASK